MGPNFVRSNADDTGNLLEEQEASITHDIAFVCSYSEDPLHVMAVYLQCNHNPPSIEVYAAANSGKHQVLIDTFKLIRTILEDESKCGIPKLSNSTIASLMLRSIPRREPRKAATSHDMPPSQTHTRKIMV